jgi:hypothetical protein
VSSPQGRPELIRQVLEDDDIKAAFEFLNDIMAEMENPTFEDKRRVLDAFMGST